MKKILGIIPARYDSTRLPGKPLIDISGKPMIQHVYERAKLSRYLYKIIVATDDERILKTVRDFGGEAIMTSKDLANGTSRAAQAIEIYKDKNIKDKNINENINSVVNIQGDEPLIDPLMIDEVCELLKNNENNENNECVTLCKELENIKNNFENPNIVKVVLSKNDYAIYFSRSKIPYFRNKIKIPVYQHIGIYGYTIDFLKKYVSLPSTPLSEAESLEQLKILENDYKIKIKITKSKARTIGVDTIEDLEEVRRILCE